MLRQFVKEGMRFYLAHQAPSLTDKSITGIQSALQHEMSVGRQPTGKQETLEQRYDNIIFQANTHALNALQSGRVRDALKKVLLDVPATYLRRKIDK